VPGPSIHEPGTAGHTLLYHSSLVQEASQYLSAQSNTLARSLSAALSTVSADDIQLTAKNAAAAAGQPPALHQTSPLASLIASNNPAVFHTQSQWAALNSHRYPQNLNNGGYVNSSGPSGGDYLNANSRHGGQNNSVPGLKTESAAGNGQPFDNLKLNLPNSVKVEAENHMMKATIKLNKMSEEDQVSLSIKLFPSSLTGRRNKLVSLSMASFFRLVYYFCRVP
jgi:hypothetical protein